MSVIYQPKGRAGEYAQLAVNLARGCAHGCIYPCYAAGLARQTPEQFALNPRPRKDILRLLERDAQALAGDPRHVHLCFTCDPYQPGEADWHLTDKAIAILLANNLRVEVLTKGGTLAERDLPLLASRPGNRFGITLTGLHPNHALKWEPRAALPVRRLGALAEACHLGISTKVSLEPVLFPAHTLECIRIAARVTDHFAVGRWNAGSAGCQIVWPAFRAQVVELLESLGYRRLTNPHAPREGKRTYYIKHDLAVAA
ncbi:MAG: radical SAM protein [Desulfarculus sp.]|nr:radical SAM protein [Desulfarculus sp.]